MAKKKTTKPAEAAAAIEGLSFPELLRLTANNLTAEAFPVELVQKLLNLAAGNVEVLEETVGLLEEQIGYRDAVDRKRGIELETVAISRRVIDAQAKTIELQKLTVNTNQRRHDAERDAERKVAAYNAFMGALEVVAKSNRERRVSNGKKRWEGDKTQDMKKAIRAEWDAWQADRSRYRYPRDFRRAMMLRFHEAVDGTMKNWMSEWGREP